MRKKCIGCGLCVSDCPNSYLYLQDKKAHTQKIGCIEFATRCIEAGVKSVVLKNWLGHTNIHITLDTYADVYGSLNSASIETLEKYLEG